MAQGSMAQGMINGPGDDQWPRAASPAAPLASGQGATHQGAEPAAGAYFRIRSPSRRSASG